MSKKYNAHSNGKSTQKAIKPVNKAKLGNIQKEAIGPCKPNYICKTRTEPRL